MVNSSKFHEPEPQFEVNWDNYGEKFKPINWPLWKKCINIALVSWLTFIASIASSMCAPGVPSLIEEFHSSSELRESFVVSIFVLGYAVGTILFAPLSELYGRVIIYHISNVGFLFFTFLCAVSTDIDSLIYIRFLSGVAGAAPLALGGGTITDLVRPERRGLAISVYFMAPLLGPAIGPVAGGYITQGLNWRWTFFVTAILSAVATLLCFPFLSETHRATLLRRRAKHLRGCRDNSSYHCVENTRLSSQALLLYSLQRPVKMLIFNPIVTILSIILAVAYGYFFILVTTFTTVFEQQYHLSTGDVGLSYLGLGVGFTIGVLTNAWLNDRIANRKTVAANGVRMPEYRLPLMAWSIFLTPVGLFLYAWTAEYKLHFILPILGTVLVGAGLILIMMTLQTYLIDAFTTYAASAIAASTILRCLLGAFLPLAGRPMYNALGIGWGTSLLGFISLVLCPLPWLVIRFGEPLRLKFPFNG